MEQDELLTTIGTRVRRLRASRGLTGRALAEASDLSVRFLSQLEAGRANIAVGRLQRVAAALEVSLEALVGETGLAGAGDGPRASLERILAGASDADVARCLRLVEMSLAEDPRAAISLLGMRGAGKSTLGPRLAERLGLPFVELDERIQEAAGLALTEIFAIHGEAYYRRLEGRCLAELFGEGVRRVIELPGGIVQNADAFGLALRHGTTIWLSATPEDHMQRVLAQGDTRPVADRDDAMAELRAILETRLPMYARASVTVDTSGRDADDVLDATLSELAAHGWVGNDAA